MSSKDKERLVSKHYRNSIEHNKSNGVEKSNEIPEEGKKNAGLGMGLHQMMKEKSNKLKKKKHNQSHPLYIYCPHIWL